MTSNRSSNAFSLVEVVLAIGMLSFSLVGLLGLMPMVLGSVRESMNLTTQTLIIQSLASEVQTLNFSQVTNTATLSSTFPRVYNDMGTALPKGTTGADAAFQVTLSISACQVPASSKVSAPARQLTFQVQNNRKKSDKSTYAVWVVDNGH